MINKTVMISKRLLFPAVACAVLSGVPVQAAVFNTTFLSTVSSANVDNVFVGDAAKITFSLDNGGSSLLNQTWTDSDIVTVTFDFGNGAHKTVFNPNGVNGLTNPSIGSFVTDASGQLTAVPSRWIDNDNVNVVSTNSTQTPIAWFVNGINPIYFTNSGSVSINNFSGNIVASNWTIASASQATTPEPSTIFGLLAIGSLGALTRKRKG